jgi:hypothetical protein
LEKLEDFQSSEYMTTINLFGNVWGCGPNIAKSWYDQVKNFLSIPNDSIGVIT